MHWNYKKPFQNLFENENYEKGKPSVKTISMPVFFLENEMIFENYTHKYTNAFRLFNIFIQSSVKASMNVYSSK